LRLGLAEDAKTLEAVILMDLEAEEHRPTCLRCGGKLTFGKVQELDNTPFHGNGIMTDTFDVLPAYCETCGKIELYHPAYVRKNQLMAYLLSKDIKA